MDSISTEELKTLLLNVKGSQPVTITTVTEPKMRKTDNPYVGVVKVSRINGFIGFDYENSVNRQRKRENNPEEFQAKARQWGQGKGGQGRLVEHKGSTYLSLKVERTLEREFRLNGVLIPEEKLHPFLKKPSQNRQGTQKPVVFRNYRLENIRQIKIGGKTFEIAHK